MHADTNTLNIEQARFNMVEQQIRPWDVLDPQVLKLLSVVKREHFVPQTHRALAFADVAIPMSDVAGQVMLHPRIQARMLQDLAVKPTDRVLDVGTGSGYMAALLGAMAREVLSVEIDPVLATRAQSNLLDAGLGNVRVQVADASKDMVAQGLDQAGGPFDVICVNGSMTQVPAHLLAALAVGGRLLAVLGSAPVMRATRITRVTATELKHEPLWDTAVPALRGFPKAASFSF